MKKYSIEKERKINSFIPFAIMKADKEVREKKIKGIHEWNKAYFKHMDQMLQKEGLRVL